MSIKNRGNITKIKGNIQVTQHLYEILTTISQKKKEQNPVGYLDKFERLIDPVILSTFYGLYKSKELPPLKEEKFLLEKSYEFDADISDFADKLNHFLFCLWIKQHGLPDTTDDINSYREELYGFLSKIISDKYFVGVVIPFYVKKADEAEGDKSSFVHRLWSSDNIGNLNEIYSPEYLAAEFSAIQSEFMNEVVKEVSIKPPKKKTKVIEFLSKDEDQHLEFKSTLRYDIKASEHGSAKINPELEKEVLRSVCAFLNSEGGTLLIGVSNEKQILGLLNDYKFLKNQNKDGFEVFLREKLSQKIEPDIPGMVKITFEIQDGKDVCLVQVDKADVPMFLKDSIAGRELREFWIRDGNRKRPLSGTTMTNYIYTHWNQRHE